MKIGFIGPGPSLKLRVLDAEKLAAEIERFDKEALLIVDESSNEVTLEEIEQIKRGLECEQKNRESLKGELEEVHLIKRQAFSLEPIVPESKRKGHQRPYKFHR